MARQARGADEEDEIQSPSTSYGSRFNRLVPKPVLVSQYHGRAPIFLVRPLWGALLFDNVNSDARDHCACERTFLSWLRLSVYMAVVSVAIVISFHLKELPTALERRMALPLGLLFWVLALACLASGLANYITTVTKYSRREVLVQSGWKTQMVFTAVAFAIVVACIIFLAANAQQQHR